MLLFKETPTHYFPLPFKLFPPLDFAPCFLTPAFSFQAYKASI